MPTIRALLPAILMLVIATAADARFQFYNDVEPTAEPVSMSFAVTFDQLDRDDTGVRHLVEMSFEPALDVYSVWFDGERVVHRRGHGITDREVGRIFFNLGNDADPNGVMRVDRILAHTLGQPLAAWQGRDQAGRQLASGVYHLRLESASEVVTKALTLPK